MKPIIVNISTLLITTLFAGCNNSSSTEEASSSSDIVYQRVLEENRRLQKDCLDPTSILRRDFQKDFESNNFREASSKLEPCLKLTQDQSLITLINKSKFNNLLQRSRDKSIHPEYRLLSLNALMKDFPVEAEKSKDELLLIRNDIQSKKTKIMNEETAAQLKIKKSRGVHIGMSTQDVLDSSWGKPVHINQTITQHGTSEQWVYQNGYLYFDNNVLVAIQR